MPHRHLIQRSSLSNQSGATDPMWQGSSLPTARHAIQGAVPYGAAAPLPPQMAGMHTQGMVAPQGQMPYVHQQQLAQHGMLSTTIPFTHQAMMPHSMPMIGPHVAQPPSMYPTPYPSNAQLQYSIPQQVQPSYRTAVPPNSATSTQVQLRSPTDTSESQQQVLPGKEAPPSQSSTHPKRPSQVQPTEKDTEKDRAPTKRPKAQGEGSSRNLSDGDMPSEQQSGAFGSTLEQQQHMQLSQLRHMNQQQLQQQQQIQMQMQQQILSAMRDPSNMQQLAQAQYPMAGRTMFPASANPYMLPGQPIVPMPQQYSLAPTVAPQMIPHVSLAEQYALHQQQHLNPAMKASMLGSTVSQPNVATHLGPVSDSHTLPTPELTIPPPGVRRRQRHPDAEQVTSNIIPVLVNGVRQFKCKQCGRLFNSSSNLRRHVRSHFGTKPYGCRLCEKRFTTTVNRNKHEQQHWERPDKYPTSAPEALLQRVKLLHAVAKAPPMGHDDSSKSDKSKRQHTGQGLHKESHDSTLDDGTTSPTPNDDHSDFHDDEHEVDDGVDESVSNSTSRKRAGSPAAVAHQSHSTNSQVDGGVTDQQKSASAPVSRKSQAPVKPRSAPKTRTKQERNRGFDDSGRGPATASLDARSDDATFPPAKESQTSQVDTTLDNVAEESDTTTHSTDMVAHASARKSYVCNSDRGIESSPIASSPTVADAATTTAAGEKKKEAMKHSKLDSEVDGEEKEQSLGSTKEEDATAQDRGDSGSDHEDEEQMIGEAVPNLATDEKTDSTNGTDQDSAETHSIEQDHNDSVTVVT
eukprot:m.315985 g.315985  ORF g.315985 m.315985 type:complete len:799 (-) comp15977_c0_seq1:937-3333(-)